MKNKILQYGVLLVFCLSLMPVYAGVDKKKKGKDAPMVHDT